MTNRLTGNMSKTITANIIGIVEIDSKFQIVFKSEIEAAGICQHVVHKANCIPGKWLRNLH